jgi:hypothetical protein
MKNLLLAVLFSTAGFVTQAQTGKDSVKSARDFIIENENTRTTRPNIVNPEVKKLMPQNDSVVLANQKTEKAKNCCNSSCCKKKKPRKKNIR